MFWFRQQVDPTQSYLNLKIGLPPVLKAGFSGKTLIEYLKKNQIPSLARRGASDHRSAGQNLKIFLKSK